MTPLRTIELQLQHVMWLREMLVNDARIAYRWLWANRAMGVVCLACGFWSTTALWHCEPFALVWWVNLVAALLNFGLTPYNLWRGERSFNKQLQDAAMLPQAIAGMKRAREIALRCPELGPSSEPCTFCPPGQECPFTAAARQLKELKEAAR